MTGVYFGHLSPVASMPSASSSLTAPTDRGRKKSQFPNISRTSSLTGLIRDNHSSRMSKLSLSGPRLRKKSPSFDSMVPVKIAQSSSPSSVSPTRSRARLHPFNSVFELMLLPNYSSCAKVENNIPNRLLSATSGHIAQSRFVVFVPSEIYYCQ